MLVTADVRKEGVLKPDEVKACEALGIVAAIKAPLVKDGRLVAFLAVHKSNPRPWSKQDVELVEEVAERTWAAVGRARAEKALLESEERLRQAASVGTVGVLFFDLRGRISHANEAFERMSGYSAQELLRLSNWSVLTSSDFMAATMRTADELATRGETAPYEKQFVRPDGSRWWGLCAPRRLSGSGADSQCVEFIIDITETKRAREALRQSDRRYRTLAQNIRDYAIFLVDAKGIITEWTEGAQRVTGYAPEEVVGRHLSLYYTPEDIAAGMVEQELTEAARNGRAERENWRVRKDGSRFWGNEIATAVYAEDSSLQGFTKISRDLSERKRANDALRESEERFRLLVENVRDHGVFTLDPEANVTTWNTGAQRIFGYAPQEIIGHSGAILFTPEDRETGEHQKELATAARNGRASDDRWQMRKDGTHFWANGITYAMRNEDGSLRGFTKVLRDQTEAKVLAERRERLLEREKSALREAHQAMVMKDEFLAVVSHELRTPLSAILLWARMLNSGALEGEELKEAIESILRSAEAQRQLIDDLLDVSRMMSGKLRLNVRDIDPAPTIRAAVDAVRVTAEAKGVSLETDIQTPTRKVRADPDRVQQVVWNLVNNAVKFTDAGGLVNIRLLQLDHHMEITVTDTGRGISPEFLPHVFERFRQADASSTRTHGGLGLGLSISRQLVELHGGDIRVQSEGLGKGATFIVQLPLSNTEGGSAPPSPTEIRESPVPSAASIKGMKVLLVEDEPETRSAIGLVLKRHEAEVTAVDSVPAALDAFRRALAARQYDLVISDIGMPRQNGYELMGLIRQSEREQGITESIPAIAVTAYARAEDRERALGAGFAMHVSKPVDPEVLVDVAARVFKGEIER